MLKPYPNLAKRFAIFSVLLMVLALAITPVFAEPVTSDNAFAATGDDCVIPESGPWPPCATGGNSSGSSDCVIPESGPWPPCATGGNTAPGNSNADCVIPESGPWPPCATGGGPAPAPMPPSDGDCVIPESGPWPDCATNGNTPPAPAPGETPADDSAAIEPEIIDFITIVYASNPDEVIGVFPVVSFNAELLYQRLLANQASLAEMRNNLDAAASGDQAACDRYEDGYEEIKENGIFFIDVPADWVDIDILYYLSFIYSLDRTRPAYLSCFDAGRIDNFNYSLALQTLNEVQPLVDSLVAEAGAKLGK